MKPARFRYVRAGSLAEATALLAEAPGETKLLAGGQHSLPITPEQVWRWLSSGADSPSPAR
ncbi:MAG TPA: hypothetical protein VFS98_02495 [Methylomirabilota bacterium]|nr:hypothetical protein [Methylomirabilota bacterium]